MMTRTAGGPGSISPIDFNERKARPRLNRNTWIAIGVVGLAHVGVGVAIYHQRFELTTAPDVPEARPFEGFVITLPKVIELKPTDTVKPVPPNAPVHPTPTPTVPVDTITAVPGPSSLPSNTITLATSVTIAVPDAPPATVQPPRPPAVITSPRWASRPTAAQMDRAYPSRAIANGLAGSAQMNCLVSASGTLSNCSIVSETPRGQGFGRAASGLTQYFRLSPGTVDGQPIDGARVAFTVRFAVGE
jgi:protein TonB